MTLLASRLLDAHLARSIEMFGGKPVSRLKDLSSHVTETIKELEDGADEVFEQANRLRARGKDALNRHKAHIASEQANVDALEQVVRDLEGSNNPPEESGGSSGTFQPGER